MTGVRNAGRVALDRSLKLARLPIDVMIHFLPEERGPRKGAALMVDRADATVRATVGSLFNDSELRSDAARRRGAADERARAQSLRAEAELRKRESHEQLAQELDSATALADQAAVTAQDRRDDADAKRERRVETTRATTRAREHAIDETLSAQQAAEATQAKRDRLKVLDGQTAALDKEAAAATAADEAKRLREAATAAKAARKTSA